MYMSGESIPGGETASTSTKALRYGFIYCLRGAVWLKYSECGRKVVGSMCWGGWADSIGHCKQFLFLL